MTHSMFTICKVILTQTTKQQMLEEIILCGSLSAIVEESFNLIC